mgnify:FL=1
MKKIKYISLLFTIILLFSSIANSQKKDIKKDITKDMVLIPAGYFNLGSTTGYDDEYPVVKVWIDSFYIDSHEVTNAEYKIFCDSTKTPYPPNPPWDTAYFTKKPNYPVINVTWSEAQKYADWVGKRLPTEAEWEKACKAGSDTKYFCGDTITNDNANFNGKNGKDTWENTSPVKSFSPNKYGVYDMIGNVWEWVNDYYQKEYYFTISDPNPKGPSKGTLKVVRGGSWDSSYEYLRSALRGKINPNSRHSNLGFRCAYSLKDKK